MPVPARVQVARWSPTSGGPAALGTVLKAYGWVISQAELERLADAAGKKATLESLEQAARTVKARTRISRISLSELPAQPLPAVAEWSEGEFRVVIDTRGEYVDVFDPATGTRGWLSAQQLGAGWTGRVLLLHPRAL
jgi:ABC-type bacteriocin/lantibiotic exporter with double-glycine peptidase domain